MNEKTKIAEIHYYSSNYSIICGSCPEICIDYSGFVQHYQLKHLVKEEEHSPDLIVELNCKLDQCIEVDDQESNSTLYDDQQQEVELQGDLTKPHDEDSSVAELDWSHTFSPNLLSKNQKRPYKPRNQPNKCSYCSKTFRRRYQLDTHLLIHTGLKPHQCDICGRQFRAANTLQRHLNTHRDRESFTCKYCTKVFSHRAAYVSHETRHTQERQVPCDECGKLFYTENQLDTHQRKMHHKIEQQDDEKLPYGCDLCYKKYRSGSMLSTHKFRKHYRTAKYNCEQCGKKFVKEEQLMDHNSRIHIIKDES